MAKIKSILFLLVVVASFGFSRVSQAQNDLCDVGGAFSGYYHVDAIGALKLGDGYHIEITTSLGVFITVMLPNMHGNFNPAHPLISTKGKMIYAQGRCSAIPLFGGARTLLANYVFVE